MYQCVAIDWQYAQAPHSIKVSQIWSSGKNLGRKCKLVSGWGVRQSFDSQEWPTIIYAFCVLLVSSLLDHIGCCAQYKVGLKMSDIPILSLAKL